MRINGRALFLRYLNPIRALSLGLVFGVGLLWPHNGNAVPFDLQAVDSAPRGSPPLLQAPVGQSAIAGRILAVDGQPLEGVKVSDGSSQTRTDAQGRYLLSSVPSGQSIIIIDARLAPSVGHSTRDFGYYEVRVSAEQGKTVGLPYVNWLTPIDHTHDVELEEPLQQARSITTPAIPSLELRLPAGAVLTDPDRHLVKRIGLTRIDIRRPPFPFPLNIHVPTYFTAQPGGTIISGAGGAWLGAQVVYPNYWHDTPHARGRFWRYQPDKSGWSMYGTGRVASDGRQVVPDKGTRIYELTGAMFDSANAPPDDARNCNDCNGGGGDPVDLGSGIFSESYTDLSVKDVLPISITRTYQSDDFQSRAFGVGMNLSYDIYLSFPDSNCTSSNPFYPSCGISAWNATSLVMPDGSQIPFVNTTPDGGGCFLYPCYTPQLVSYKPGKFYLAHLSWGGGQIQGNPNGAEACCWTLITREGTSYYFGDQGPLQAYADRLGNTVTFLREDPCGNINEQGVIAQITSPNGRHIYINWNKNCTANTYGTISSVSDDAGRTVSYQYETGTPTGTLLQYVTDADHQNTSVKSQYLWTTSNQLKSFIDNRSDTVFTNTYCTSANCGGATSPALDPIGQVQTQVLADGSSYAFAYSATGTGTMTTMTATLPNVASPVVTTALFDGNSPTGSFTGGYQVSSDRAAGTSIEEDKTYCYYSDSNNPATCPASSAQPAACPTGSGPVTQALADVIDNVGWTDSGGGTHTTRDTHFAYDAFGNTACSTRLYGTTDAVTTSFTYSSSYNLLASVTDPLGHSRTYLRPEPTEVAVAVTDANNLTYNFQYNPQGEVTSVTDPLGLATQINYDLGDVASVTFPVGDPLQRTTSYYSDILGRRVRATDALGNTSQYAYDPLYGVTTYSDPAGETTTTLFDPVGNVSQVANANTGSNQGVTKFQYDTTNRVTTRTDPVTKQDVYSKYTGYNAPTKAVDRNGKSITYTFDLLGRVNTAKYSDGSLDTYTWDTADRVTLIKETGGQSPDAVDYVYDALDRVTCASTTSSTAAPCPLSNANYNTTKYAYDAAGRLISKNITGQTVISYHYDNGDRLTSINQAGSATSIKYDNDNRRQSITYPANSNGSAVVATLTWDNAAELASISYSNVPKSGQPTLIGNLTYGYDLDGRVVGRGGSLFQANLSSPVVASYNAADRIISRTTGGSTQTPQWDNDGNLICDNLTGTTCGGSAYTWDSRNRLIGLVSPTAGTFIYTYDPLNRRRTNVTAANVGSSYLSDGWNVAQEQNASGTATANLLNGLALDERYVRNEINGSSTTTLAYLVDALGSTVALANNGAVQTSYSYDPFGVQVSVTGTSDTNTNGFTGRELDLTGLQYNRNRYYNPAWGRFISEDPIGLVGGINRYAYVGNDPVNFRDPLGLFDPAGFEAGLTEAGEAEAIGLGPEDPLADAVALGALAYGLEQSLTAPDPATAPQASAGGGGSKQGGGGQQCTGGSAGGGGGGSGGGASGGGGGPPIPPQSPYSFTKQALQKMNSRYISPGDVDSALKNLARPGYVNPESGNNVFDGANGVRVVVDPVTDEIVSLHVP